ncbi:diguanylate cyclase [Thermoleptolyngbya sichuanensis A183]|uniref:Diguanylate cyclase n=1 Tax=Thermoleptolyngbya sichuanensis A183 TaxID=2737172 RepID=A0A6M8BJ90_9CYAN|nr:MULTISPECIES: diguanylate cyclase [Thermoleptolyngbya]QKD84576.1 diguanylate cyclase [Thermoleptolyngbya sichuanensis A183]
MAQVQISRQQLFAEGVLHQFLSVESDTAIAQVIRTMSETRSSFALVLRAGQLVGIFTERDVVRAIARGSLQPAEAIATVMVSPVITLAETDLDDLLAVLQIFRQHQIRHLPILGSQGEVLGVMTPNSIRNLLQPSDLLKFRQVSDVMVSRVVSALPSTSVTDLAHQMTQHRVSCVVIVPTLPQLPDAPENQAAKSDLTDGSQGDVAPLGIVTEQDIVRFQADGLNLAQTYAGEVMSTPLLQTSPQQSLWSAYQQMQENRIRRLVVVGSRGELVGILTQTSVVHMLDPLELCEVIRALQSTVTQKNDALHQEIRRRQALTDALASSEALLREAQALTHMGSWELDVATQTVTWSTEVFHVFGLDPTQPAPTLAENEQQYHPEDRPRLRRILSKAIATGQPFRFQARIIRPDGSIRHIEARGRARQSSDGTVTKLFGTAQDITEQKQLEQLLRSQVQQQRLLASMTQRIRQSLDLDAILSTTVHEVRQFFQVDRVLIGQFGEDWRCGIAVESVEPGRSPMLGANITPEPGEDWLKFYVRGHAKAIDCLERANLSAEAIAYWRQFQVQAALTVGLLQGDRLWGLLSVQQCHQPRTWERAEIDLIQQLASQVGIAIQQSELYRQLQYANQELAYLATHDQLTRVANRRYLDDYLQQEWNRAAREGTPLSLVLCDVDYFKQYNDTHGHLAGDECLMEIATAIGRALHRPADFVARYGGEEFAIVLPNTNRLGAVRVVQRIQKELRNLTSLPPSPVTRTPSTLSFGIVSVIPSSLSSPLKLLDQSDRALYRAKAQGRNRYCMD